MMHALSPAGRLVIEQVLRGAPLLAFDFDGTLAPWIAEPAAAELTPRTGATFANLASRWPCIVVSGRARADVRSRLLGIPVVEVVGNHGSEPWIDPAPLRAEVARWLPLLDQLLGNIPGVLIEDKGCSVSIHYRRALSRHTVLGFALDAARRLGIERILSGKYVLNLLPAGALHKGDGLCRAMAALKKTSALYVGADETDEDVFRLPPAAGVLGIRVDYRMKSCAPLYLYGQPEVDELLGFLSRSAEAFLTKQL